MFLCILGVEHIEVINGEQVVWIFYVIFQQITHGNTVSES